jgi:uncharacterized protein (DUF58 family)
MKKKVSFPDLNASNFKWHSRYYDFKNNIYFNAHLFNNLNFFFCAIWISFWLGIKFPYLWSLTLSFVTYLLIAFFRTKRIADGIRIKRVIPKRGREHDDFEIVYEVSNTSGFTLPGLSFRQSFDGTQEGQIEVKTSAIPPQTRDRVAVKAKLNAGMGIKSMGGFTVHVIDELNLFHFPVSFEDTHELEVFPFIEETPLLKKSISPDSIDFGQYDIQKRGESNLFIGTREYRHGDPVRHINWKLSRKTSKLIVNEFEKNTNTYVTLLLDLELNNQVGIGAFSTWEAAKDLALSIAANEIRQRNYVQVLAQNLFVPFGTGQEQMITLERHFTYHELSNSGLDHLNRLGDLPSASQIYFFCPLLLTLNVKETINSLKQLRLLGQHVTILALDPYKEVRNAVSNISHAPITVAGEEARKQFVELGKELRSSGIPLVIIDVKSKVSLAEMLRVRGRQILEERPQ